MNGMKLSIVIPARNEQENIGPCLQELTDTLVTGAGLTCEIIVVDDGSDDETSDRVRAFAAEHAELDIRLIRRSPPPGFGRAVREGLRVITGDAVVIYMADRSDDPGDVLRYYRKLEEGYDCVFGSRFIRGSHVTDYPRLKLVVNRIVNRALQLMFWTSFNDLTNAFKAYRRHVIEEAGPFHSCHFNITIEMSLAALIRRYQIAQIPMSWYGRTWGSSHLRLKEMGRKYLAVLLKMLAEKWLLSDDLIAEKLARHRQTERTNASLDSRLAQLEERLARLEAQSTPGGADAAPRRLQVHRSR